jgi:hypothetical protein
MSDEINDYSEMDPVTLCIQGTHTGILVTEDPDLAVSERYHYQTIEEVVEHIKKELHRAVEPI